MTGTIEWKRPDEQLPPENENVLVSAGDYVWPGYYAGKGDWPKAAGAWRWSSGGYIHQPVECWALIPQPPRNVADE